MEVLFRCQACKSASDSTIFLLCQSPVNKKYNLFNFDLVCFSVSFKFVTIDAFKVFFVRLRLFCLEARLVGPILLRLLT